VLRTSPELPSERWVQAKILLLLLITQPPKRSRLSPGTTPAMLNGVTSAFVAGNLASVTVR